MVLAAIFLSVIFWSLEADAQPTVNESMSCDGTFAIEEAVKEIKVEIADKYNDLKTLLASSPINGDAADLSKQALVSALNCEYKFQLNSLSMDYKLAIFISSHDFWPTVLSVEPLVQCLVCLSSVRRLSVRL